MILITLSANMPPASFLGIRKFGTIGTGPLRRESPYLSTVRSPVKNSSKSPPIPRKVCFTSFAKPVSELLEELEEDFFADSRTGVGGNRIVHAFT